MKKILFLILFLLPVSTAQAMDSHASHMSKYKGQENRAIKSLSSRDIEELQQGGGWGFAKAAELNGIPGPSHLLQMKEKIGLSDQQIKEISILYNDMKSKAMPLGIKLIDRERMLEAHFSAGTITDALLRSILSDIAKIRKELRYTHLAAHLKTPQILDKEQIAKYNSLRGY